MQEPERTLYRENLIEVHGLRKGFEGEVIIPEIGKDGRCMCSCAHVCPLYKSGSELRCTEAELDRWGVQY